MGDPKRPANVGDPLREDLTQRTLPQVPVTPVSEAWPLGSASSGRGGPASNRGVHRVKGLPFPPPTPAKGCHAWGREESQNWVERLAFWFRSEQTLFNTEK